MNKLFLSSVATLAIIATSCESTKTPYIRNAKNLPEASHSSDQDSPDGHFHANSQDLANDFTSSPLDLGGDGTIIPEAEHGFTAVLFSFDSALIGSSYNNKLNQLANYLIQNPSYTLTIEGHSDERGSEEYNRALSEQRALSAKEAIINIDSNLGSRISTVGYGEEKPKEIGTSESAYKQNRRADFIIRKRG